MKDLETRDRLGSVCWYSALSVISIPIGAEIAVAFTGNPYIRGNELPAVLPPVFIILACVQTDPKVLGNYLKRRGICFPGYDE